eukprot:EG_transcript_20027
MCFVSGLRSDISGFRSAPVLTPETIPLDPISEVDDRCGLPPSKTWPLFAPAQETDDEGQEDPTHPGSPSFQSLPDYRLSLSDLRAKVPRRTFKVSSVVARRQQPGGRLASPPRGEEGPPAIPRSSACFFVDGDLVESRAESQPESGVGREESKIGARPCPPHGGQTILAPDESPLVVRKRRAKEVRFCFPVQVRTLESPDPSPATPASNPLDWLLPSQVPEQSAPQLAATPDPSCPVTPATKVVLLPSRASRPAAALLCGPTLSAPRKRVVR